MCPWTRSCPDGRIEEAAIETAPRPHEAPPTERGEEADGQAEPVVPVAWAEGSVRTTGAISARRGAVEVGSEERSVNEPTRQVGPEDTVVGAAAEGWREKPGDGALSGAVLGRLVGPHDAHTNGQADGPLDLLRRLLRSPAPALPAGAGVDTVRYRAVGAVVVVLVLVGGMLWWGLASQRVPVASAPSVATVSSSSMAAAAPTPTPVDAITVHVPER